MEFFRTFQLFLVKSFILSAPVEDGIRQQRRKWITFHWYLMLIGEVRMALIVLSMVVNSSHASFIRYWLGDFMYFIGPMGYLINSIVFVIQIASLRNRWMIGIGEERQQLYLFETLSSDLKSLPRQNRGTIVKILGFIMMFTISFAIFICWLIVLPVFLISYVIVNFQLQDTGFAFTSALGLGMYLHGLLLGLTTMFSVHGLIAMIVEYTIARIKVVMQEALFLLTNQEATETINRKFSFLLKNYFSIAQEIRRHNQIISFLLRSEIIVLCPVLAIAIVFLIVDAPQVIKIIITVGVSTGLVVMFTSIGNIGRAHSAMLSFYPVLNTIQVRTGQELDVKSKLRLKNVIKELGSQEIPSFTLTDSYPFTKITASQFVVATISFCLLLIINLHH